MVARLPYISMPTRYTREAIQTNAAIAMQLSDIASAICQNGGVSASIRTGMVSGANSGAIETQNDKLELGSRMTAKLK